MASPVGSRAGLGWAILVAALSVPGVWYYYWSSNMKAERERSVAAKARSRLADGAVFQTQPGGTRPMSAVAASTSAAPGGPAAKPLAGATPASLPAPAPGVAAAAPVSAPAAPPAPPPSQAQPAGAAPGTPGAFVPPVVASVVSSTAAIVLSRDPMMSPMDLVRQREAEAEAERNAEAIRRAAEERNRPRAKVRRVEPKIDTRIELQGIVARPDGENLAIVNGTTVNPGETFAVDGFSAKVKVVRITSSEVIFEYKGKKFRKNVNAE